MSFMRQIYAREEFVRKGTLGSGAFGEVWLVKHSQSNIEYAFKAFKSNASVKVIRDEINILSKSLNHPHIVKYIGEKIVKDRRGILMEYCAGGNLHNFLTEREGKNLLENEVLTWMIQIASALQYCHERVPILVHRDLKPENILLNGNELKVGDFGFATEKKTANPVSITKQGRGTPGYRAPEICNISGTFGAPSDIWALGCIVHEMCNLNKLFKDDAALDLMLQQNCAPSRIHSSYSDDLWRIVNSMLQVNFSSRPTGEGICKSGMGLLFTDNKLRPQEVGADGSCDLQRIRAEEWEKILEEEYDFKETASLCPILLNKPIVDGNVAIVFYAHKWNNEFRFFGRFHPKVDKRVSPLNMKLGVKLTFSKENREEYFQEKTIIATVEHRKGWLFKLYEVPFNEFSKSPPSVQISITKVSPEESWHYFGLQRQFSQNGTFEIDCKVLQSSAFDNAIEWKKMVEEDWKERDPHLDAYLPLPPLVLRENVAVCVIGFRNDNVLSFAARLHPCYCASDNSKSLEVSVAIDLHVKKMLDDNTIVEHRDGTVTLNCAWANFISFADFPWHLVSPNDPPRITLSMKQ